MFTGKLLGAPRPVSSGCVTIRAATAADAAAVAGLFGALCRHEEGRCGRTFDDPAAAEREVRRLVSGDASTVLVACKMGGEIAGCIAAEIHGRSAEVGGLFARPGAPRPTAVALIRGIVGWLEDRGVDDLRVAVARVGTRAVPHGRLYERLGLETELTVLRGSTARAAAQLAGVRPGRKAGSADEETRPWDR